MSENTTELESVPRFVIANEDLMVLGVGYSREAACENFAENAWPSIDRKLGWEEVERLEWDTDNIRRPKDSDGRGLRVYTIPAEHALVEEADLNRLLIDNRKEAEAEWRDRFDIAIFAENEKPQWLKDDDEGAA